MTLSTTKEGGLLFTCSDPQSISRESNNDVASQTFTASPQRRTGSLTLFRLKKLERHSDSQIQRAQSPSAWRQKSDSSKERSNGPLKEKGKSSVATESEKKSVVTVGVWKKLLRLSVLSLNNTHTRRSTSISLPSPSRRRGQL